MTALKGRAIEAFVKARDKAVAAVLIYGPDGGLVRERGEILAKTIVEDLKDPFNYLELSDADLKAEPSRLADEAAALSFAGGERVIRLRTSGESSAAAAKNLIKGLDAGHLKANGLVIIEAGELRPASGLRKAFEKSKAAVALPCYTDGPADVRAMAVAAAALEALRFEDDALDLVVSVLGEDHGVSRSEIDKLILYKGPQALRSGPQMISIDDVRASLVDGLGDALDEAAGACADGAPARLANALMKCSSAGASPIGVLKAIQRQFSRIEAARNHMDAGESAASAMKKLRPPVFFAEQRAFERRLHNWPGPRAKLALRMLIDAELDAKSTGAPAAQVIERTALRLAVMGKR